ncbi:MAG: ABC transporter permease [Burkholderiales bacterium]|nr:ABC transporter permease [Burkholderiales bacterium]
MKLALRLLARESRAGELTLMFIALVVAVAAVTTVSFFTDRVRQALTSQANQLLAADMILISDHPIPVSFEAQAMAFGLSSAHTLAFPSMVIQGTRNQLAEVKGVSLGYPLRGELNLSRALFGPVEPARSGPQPGTAWADARLMQALGLKIGEVIELGQARLTLAAVIAKEPDRAGDFFNIAPRLMVHVDDIAATSLIQPGSRVGYRLLIAGEAKALSAYRKWAETRLARGERIEGVSDARPEIRAALERAERYLGLAALVSAILAAVAVALASRQFVLRHLDSCAVLRCLGASQAAIFRLYLIQFVILGLAASAVGSLIGFGGQAGLAEFMRGRIVNDLPTPSLWPLAEGLGVGLLLLLAFGLPPLMRLKSVPTLRVLRRELGVPKQLGLASYALGAATVAGVLMYRAGEIKLGLYVLAGLSGVVLGGLLLGGLLLHVIASLRGRVRGVWFYGLANVGRRRASSLTQIIGFALGLMALLLLTLVRGDLLASWQSSLPPDAPNRFVINIQPDQLPRLEQFFHAQKLESPVLYPMVRGRLVAINERPINAKDYPEERAQRLVEREFNLSWAALVRSDNRITAGHWWRAQEVADQFSVEQGIAETLGIKLNDRLTYEIAGTRVTGRVTSLRKVDWDTMRVNFFVIGSPALLQTQPATYITSFHLPAGREALLNDLVRQFPNFTVIDVAAIMSDVRAIMERVSEAVTFVFLFTLLAGLVVLYAAVMATRDERLYEAAVMRTLGAATRQLANAQWIEFATLGALAGVLAATGASVSAFVLAQQVLHLPFVFNPWVWVVGVVGGAAGITLAGMMATRSVLRTPPLSVLRRINA